MAKRKRRDGAINRNRYAIALALIIMVGVYLSMAFVYGPTPINGADDYIYAHDAFDVIHSGIHYFGSGGEDDLKYIVVFGISFFYFLLGPSPFSASLFGVACFAITIVVVYKIGMELYNRNAGILSAFLYAIMPLPNAYASIVGDNVPMALFASLTVLCLVIAVKRKNTHYFELAGFLSLIGFLTSPEFLVILAFVFAFLLIYLVQEVREKSGRQCLNSMGAFFFGVIIALLVMVLLGALTGYEFPLSYGSSDFNSAPLSSPLAFAEGAFAYYLLVLFPYNVVNTLTAHAPLYSTVYSLIAYYVNPPNTAPLGLGIGLYGYFMVASVVLLVALRKRAAFVPALWFVTTLLYLAFGTTSLTSYHPIPFTYTRFMLIFAPAIALMIGFAFIAVLEVKNKYVMYIKPTICVIPMALLVANAISTTVTFNVSQGYGILPLLQAATFINGLPANTTVYWGDLPMDIYTYYSPSVQLYPPNMFQMNCSNVAAGAYIVTRNPYAPQICGNLTLVFHPTLLPNSTLAIDGFQYNRFNYFAPYCDCNEVRIYYRT